MNSKGFSMIEVMAVVAIIGILSVIAVPTYKKHKARSRRTEAKILLSGAYMAQAGLMQVYNHYGTCLSDANFLIDNVQNRNYAVGFAAENPTANALITGSGGTCNAGNFQFDASNNLSGQMMTATGLASVNTSGADAGSGISTPGVNNTGEAFVVGAIGYIYTGNLTIPTASQWAINHEKQLIEINVGY
jgi:prepilin-type N-terminal cleavage/methylation domain-containing protein